MPGKDQITRDHIWIANRERLHRHQQQQQPHQHHYHQSPPLPPPLPGQAGLQAVPSSAHHVLHIQTVDPPSSGLAASVSGGSSRLLHQIRKQGFEVLKQCFKSVKRKMQFTYYFMKMLFQINLLPQRLWLIKCPQHLLDL